MLNTLLLFPPPISPFVKKQNAVSQDSQDNSATMILKTEYWNSVSKKGVFSSSLHNHEKKDDH